MVTPFILSYPDARLDDAYRRYQSGETQQSAATSSGYPLRSLKRRCSADGWEAERAARRAEAEIPTLAPAALGDDGGGASLAPEAATSEPNDAQVTDALSHTAVPSASTVEAEPEEEVLDGRAGIDLMLKQQQRMYGRLIRIADWATAQLAGGINRKTPQAVLAQARIELSKVTQLTIVLGRLFDMGRKAYRVPDKMEVEDTTPAAQRHADAVRQLMKQVEAEQSEIEKPGEPTAASVEAGPHGPM